MKPNDFGIDPALPLREVRRLVGCGNTTLFAAIKAGRLATFKNGNRRYARASAVAAFIDAIEAGSRRD